jgi:hypothetical protein
MRKARIIIAVLFVSVLTCNIAWSEDFYVIPIGKRNHAPVEKTGQTTCYNTEGETIDCAGTGQDGDFQEGVNWPIPRFTDNGNGTVTDNLTGLIWPQHLGCHFGDWQSGLDFCNGLASGTCWLTDNSEAGDWRLANRKELLSLLDQSQYNPAIPAGHPFIVSSSAVFISSTTSANSTTAAWEVSIYAGTMGLGTKTGNWYGACVRSDR